MSLCVQNLSFSYQESRPVLQDVSFSVEHGEFLSVLGPNGVGKSTLFRCILGFMTDYSGTVSVDGEHVSALSRRELARRIAYIPQNHRPTFGYSVFDVALMGTTRQLSPFSSPGQEQKQQARAALQRLGIEHLSDRNFAHLSGGEQQLVLIARALAQQAKILVMDEPTSALDYGNQLRVLSQVRELSHDGYTVLLSTHNPQNALSFADRILALSGGTVAAWGPSVQVLTPALMQTLYRVNVDFAETDAGRVIFPRMQGGMLL